MAEVTFNRELGAAPAGITRFGQYRSENGGNVTVNSTTEDTSEGRRRELINTESLQVQLEQEL